MVDQPAASFPSTPARTTMPEWYSQLLDAIAQRVSLGWLSATTAVNRELTATNWAIGRLILQRVAELPWRQQSALGEKLHPTSFLAVGGKRSARTIKPQPLCLWHGLAFC